MSIKGNKKHFVFDFDDTVVDGRKFCGESMARAITQLDPNIDFDDVVDYHELDRGLTIVDLFKGAIEELRANVDLEEVLKIDAQIQTTEFHNINIFEGVAEVLEYLKNRGKTLHVSTNRTMETLIPIMEHNGLHGFFDTVTSCKDAGFKKPDPTCLHKLVEDNGGDMSEFIYFGDSEVDRDYAKNAGMDFIIFDQYLNDRNLFRKLIEMFLG